MSQSKKNVRDLSRYVDFIRMRTNDAMNAIEQDFPFKLTSSNYHIHAWNVQLLNQIVNALNSKRQIFDWILCSTFRLLFSRISNLTLKVWGHLSVWHILVYFIEETCEFIEIAAVCIIFKNLLIFLDMSAFRQCFLFGTFWFDFIAMDATHVNN